MSIPLEANIWEDSLRHPPITVRMDPTRNCYHVQDATRAVIWADDLPAGGCEELLAYVINRCNVRKTAFLNNIFAHEAVDNALRHRKTLACTAEIMSGMDMGKWLHLETSFGNGGSIIELQISQLQASSF